MIIITICYFLSCFISPIQTNVNKYYPTFEQLNLNNDKDSSIDDPIRLYLREIGKENLLTAEQEVTLSKQMEDGENIIKDVIKHS